MLEHINFRAHKISKRGLQEARTIAVD